MTPSPEEVKAHWDASFREQIARHAYNTAPVESVIRTVAYHLRQHPAAATGDRLRFFEMGCGAGPNLVWLADRGIDVGGIDISPEALELARLNLQRSGYADRVGRLIEGSVELVPLPDGSFDGIIEACVFQHLGLEARVRAFGEVSRLLKKGGLFVGYDLSVDHTIYRERRYQELLEDPGTLLLADGSSRIHLTNLGLSHFFKREEWGGLLKGFSRVEPLEASYTIPAEEARRRGFGEYVQAMWIVYAIK